MFEKFNLKMQIQYCYYVFSRIIWGEISADMFPKNITANGYLLSKTLLSLINSSLSKASMYSQVVFPYLCTSNSALSLTFYSGIYGTSAVAATHVPSSLADSLPWSTSPGPDATSTAEQRLQNKSSVWIRTNKLEALSCHQLLVLWITILKDPPR